MRHNEAAIHLVKNGKSNSDRTKHIALRHFFVKQYLDDGTFHIVHCPTEETLNDVNVRKFMAYELEDLAKERDAAMRRQNRREAPGPNVDNVDDDLYILAQRRTYSRAVRCELLFVCLFLICFYQTSYSIMHSIFCCRRDHERNPWRKIKI